MAMSADYRSKFAAFHREFSPYKWKILEWDENHKQKNKQKNTEMPEVAW